MSASLDEPGSTQEFETLVQYIRNNRGFDFTGSKRSSLGRRVGKRMQSLRIERYGDYLDYLRGASQGISPTLQYYHYQCHRFFS